MLLALASAALLSGCADYLNHRDTITFYAGNAVEANKGIHIKEPFPAVAENRRVPTDGKVIYRAVRSYQTGADGSYDILPETTRGMSAVGTSAGNGASTGQ